MRIAVVAGVLIFSVVPTMAQDAKPRAEDGKRPSEIVALIEGRPDFLRLIDMSWNDRGYYEVEYRTRDKAKVEINIDAKSGEPIEQE